MQGSSRQTARSCRSSALGCRYSVVGARLSVLGCRYSVVGTRLSVLGCRYSVVGTRLSVLGYRIPDTGYRIPDTGYRTPDTEHRIPNTGGRVIRARRSRYICDGHGKHSGDGGRRDPGALRAARDSDLSLRDRAVAAHARRRGRRPRDVPQALAALGGWGQPRQCAGLVVYRSGACRAGQAASAVSMAAVDR